MGTCSPRGSVPHVDHPIVHWIAGELAARGLTQKQLAQSMGLRQPGLSEIMRGGKPISLDFAARCVRLGMEERLYWEHVASLGEQLTEHSEAILASIPQDPSAVKPRPGAIAWRRKPRGEPPARTSFL